MTVFVLCCILLIGLPHQLEAVKWLAIHKLSPAIEAYSDPSKLCPRNKEQRKELGLVASQVRICLKMSKVMPFLTNAARNTVHSCQKVFSDRRWNCSSITAAPNLKPDLTKGTKEQAFVYALSAAALTYQVAKACASGEMEGYCACGYGDSTAVTSSNNGLEDVYKWKGCSDNIVYGKRLSREWTDSSSWKRMTRKPAWPNSKTHFLDGVRKRNIESSSLLNQQASTYSVEGAISRTIGPKAKMNQHNSDVGRSITEQSLYRKCKCHGVSSSCDVRTCWYTLPPLEQIAERLKERYNTAQMINPHYTDEIKIDTRSLRTTSVIGMQDLVYLKISPDYCEEDVDMGSFGTRMRECNVSSDGAGSCESLCCGRGFNTQQVKVEEACHCKYVHCCYIKCKNCVFVLDKHFCK